MQLASERVGTEQTAELPASSCQSRCPMCSAPLVELRATLRCSRCYFSICEGCDGAPGDNLGASGE
jgi:hypothetical protein